MVTLAAAGEPVIVWRAIQEGWTVACDEVSAYLRYMEDEPRRTYVLQSSMTMFLRHAGTESVKGTVEKLRFVARKDYWSFVAQYASSRVQAYTGAWAAEDTTTDPTLTVYSETMESAS